MLARLSHNVVIETLAPLRAPAKLLCIGSKGQAPQCMNDWFFSTKVWLQFSFKVFCRHMSNINQCGLLQNEGLWRRDLFVTRFFSHFNFILQGKLNILVHWYMRWLNTPSRIKLPCKSDVEIFVRYEFIANENISFKLVENWNFVRKSQLNSERG